MPMLSPHKRWVVKQILYRDLLAELDSHFVAMGVDYMPVKGAYLILAGLAGQIEAREMLDVDIIVAEHDFVRVRDHFAACGRAELFVDEWYFEQPLMYTLGRQRLMVEIHYLLNRPERFRLPTEALFERSLQTGIRLRLPCPEDALAIAVCHGLVHIAWSGFRDEVFNDVAVIASVPDFSWERFNRIMAVTGITRFMHFFFLVQERKLRRSTYPYLRRLLLLRMLAALFCTCYGRLPYFVQRLLFEIPFVREPRALIAASGREKRGDRLKRFFSPIPRPHR
jgi:hypothetical protein